MSTVAIVAALDREIAPLVHDWSSRHLIYQGRNFRAYEHENLTAVAGGIGCAAAARAARALVEHYRPRVLVSAGLAGALRGDLKVGDLLSPSVVIDSSTEAEYRTESGRGVLVTVTEILSPDLKQRMAGRFQAAAADMEAAAVAQVAQQEGIAFRCIKAISDELNFEMPPLNRFIDEQGQLQTAKFALWAAVRPWQWAGIIRLGRNAGIASRAFCNWLVRAELGAGPGAGAPKVSGKTTQVLDV